MNSAMTLAEMANNTNYATMNYAQLTELNLALLLAVGQIKTLIPIKRREEMEKVTHTYVMVMNGYCATKDEILDCILKDGENLKEESVLHTSSKDVDDQEAPVVAPEEKTGNSGSLPALPETVHSTADSGEMPSLNEYKPEETITAEDKEQTIAEKALKDAMTRPIKDEINSDKPYFIDYSYDVDENGKLVRDNTYGHNLGSKELVEFKAASVKYLEYYMKGAIVESTEDYLVYENNSSVIVRMYHTATDSNDGVESVCKYMSDEDKKKKAKMRSIMKKAIKKAKEDALEGEDADMPYLYKCALQHGRGFLFINRRLPKQYEDAETLVEMKSAVDHYAKHYYSHSGVMSTEDGIAVMRGDKIEVIFFNIPLKNNDDNTSIMPTIREEGEKREKKVVVKKSKVKPGKKGKKASIKGVKKDPRCVAIVGTKDGETRRWNSFRDCERDLGVSPGTASQVVSGKMKSAKGWKLRRDEGSAE